MNRLRGAVFAAAMAAVTVVLGAVGLPLALISAKFTMIPVRVWSRSVLALARVICGIRVEVRGRDNLPPGACLIAAKHQSAWETIVFLTIYPHPAYVLKRELLDLPIYGWYTKRLAMIPIDRRGRSAALRDMVEKARAAIAADRPVIIFPEGTRTDPGETRKIQPGVTALFEALDVPLIPVSLNSGLFWGKGIAGKRPGTIVMQVHPPLPPGADRETLAARLRQDVQEGSAALEAESRARG